MRALPLLLPVALGCSSHATPAHAPSATEPPAAASTSAPATATTDSHAGCAAGAARFDVVVAPWLSGVSPEDELDIRARVAMLRDIFLDACQEERWAAGPTTCFAQAADMETWQACEVQLTADQRAKMQARLDAVPRPPDDIAARQVRKIAFEYYPMWSVNPKHHGCPASLAEFDSLVEPPGPQTWLDPWGTTLTFACSDATMFSVTSAGPDRKLGTADDISSADE